MAAKTAPAVGEAFLDNAMRVQYVTFGDSGTADVPLYAAIADSDNAVITPVFSWGRRWDYDLWYFYPRGYGF